MSGGPDTSSQPGNAAQSPAPAEQQTPSSAEAGFEESILDTLRYDPFSGSSKGAGAQSSPGATSPRSDQPVTPPADGVPGNAPAPASQPALAPQAQPQPDPGLAALNAAAANLNNAAERIAQVPQQAQPQGQPQDPLPNYIFDIPPALVNALASEDPVQRTTAVQHLVAGTARAVHTEVLKLMNEVKSSIPQIFQQQMQSHTYRETIRRDFFGKYPMLDNPHLAPTVASVTQQVMSEIQASGGRPAWSPQLAQAIAERVFTLIPGLRGQPGAVVPQPQPPAPVVPQVPQPPHMFTPGARPVQGPSLQAEIEQTLFG